MIEYPTKSNVIMKRTSTKVAPIFDFRRNTLQSQA
jgi:hypothetical protein